MKGYLEFGAVTIYRGDRWSRPMSWMFIAFMAVVVLTYNIRGFTDGFCDGGDSPVRCLVEFVIMNAAMIWPLVIVWQIFRPAAPRVVLRIANHEIAVVGGAPVHVVAAAAIFGVYVATSPEVERLTLWFVNPDKEVFDTIETGWRESGWRLENVLAAHGYNVLPPDWNDPFTDLDLEAY